MAPPLRQRTPPYCVQESCFDDLDAPVLRIAGAEIPMPYAANLEKLALPQVPDIISQVKAQLFNKQ